MFAFIQHHKRYGAMQHWVEDNNNQLFSQSNIKKTTIKSLSMSTTGQNNPSSAE
jgi:hypothetical protein